jgi:hypothetical protein
LGRQRGPSASGSEIDFRESTSWEQYWWQIAFVSAVVLIQAGLISLLLHERGRRHLAEVQARHRMEELAHINRFSTAGELTATIAHENQSAAWGHSGERRNGPVNIDIEPPGHRRTQEHR